MQCSSRNRDLFSLLFNKENKYANNFKKNLMLFHEIGVQQTKIWHILLYKHVKHIWV